MGTFTQVYKKQLSLGELHCAACGPDSPLVVGVGGERELRVLNLQRNAAICKHFDVPRLEPSVRARRKERSGEGSASPGRGARGAACTSRKQPGFQCREYGRSRVLLCPRHCSHRSDKQFSD